MIDLNGVVLCSDAVDDKLSRRWRSNKAQFLCFERWIVLGLANVDERVDKRWGFLHILGLICFLSILSAVILHTVCSLLNDRWLQIGDGF